MVFTYGIFRSGAKKQESPPLRRGPYGALKVTRRDIIPGTPPMGRTFNP